MLNVSMDPFQPIQSHKDSAQFRWLDHGAHVGKYREERRKAFVVMHGIGFAELEGWCETDGLAYRHPRAHAHPARVPGDLPDLACVVGGKDRGGAGSEPGMAGFLAVQCELGDPAAGSEVAGEWGGS
jgi:hypothetical protein